MKTVGVFVIGSLGCGVALGCGAWAVELTSRGVGSVDQAVALGAAALATALGAWYALTAVLVVLLHLAGASRHRAVAGLRWAAGTLGAPVLRRAAAVGLGAGLLLGAGPAVADSGGMSLAGDSVTPPAESAGREHEVPVDLRPGFLSGPQASPASPASEASEASEASPAAEAAEAAPKATAGADRPGLSPAPDPARSPAAPHSETLPSPVGRAAATAVGITTTTSTAPEHERHVVQPGDSLWAIAAEHLDGTPSNTQISAAWPRWHAANRAVIGADPNLIHPGQELVAPDQEDA